MLSANEQVLNSDLFNMELYCLTLWEDELDRNANDFSSEFNTPTYKLTNRADILRDLVTTDQVNLALSGRDTVILGAGNDKIDGGAGDGLILGGANDDLLYGQDGHDILYGGGGNDALRGDNGDDFLYGEAGDDNLSGNAGNDFISGGAGDDKLNGSSGDDTLFGEGGNDQLIGGSGNDTMLGGDGNDLLYGGNGDDILIGGKGNDVLASNGGQDILIGGEGEDRLFGGPGVDRFIFDDAKSADSITNFNAAEGDIMDISDIISYDPLTDDIADFISLTEDTQSTTLSIDANGLDGGQRFVEVAVFENMVDLDLTSLIANSNLIVS